MANLIKKVSNETIYRVDLTQREVNAIALLLGKTYDNELKELAEEYGVSVPDESYNLYDFFSKISEIE